jgi:hypothetical protein
MIHKGYLTDTHQVSQEKVEKENYATLCFSKHWQIFFTFFHDTEWVSGRYPHSISQKKVKEKKKYIYIYICPSSKALTMIIKHCLDFSFVFSARLLA